MSIWINRAAAAFASLALAACELQTGYGTARSAPVLGGSLNVGVPAGYCIDAAAGRVTPDSAVVLMGRCANTSTAVPALVSVSIGQSGSAGVMTAGGQALAAFFASRQGRATLSRDGNASDIRVMQALGLEDTLLLHLADRVAGEHWRAVTGIKGRLITLSVTGTPAAPLSAADSRRILESTLAALRRANP